MSENQEKIESESFSPASESILKTTDDEQVPTHQVIYETLVYLQNKMTILERMSSGRFAVYREEIRKLNKVIRHRNHRLKKTRERLASVEAMNRDLYSIISKKVGENDRLLITKKDGDKKLRKLRAQKKSLEVKND